MKTKVKFTLPAEAVGDATEVILLGDFNKWNPEKAPRLKRQKDGSFKAIVQLEEGQTYQYRFLLDNSRWVNDYNAQEYTNVPGYYIDNCVITVTEAVTEENKKAKTAKSNTTGKKTTAKKTTSKAAKVKSTDEKAEKTSKPIKKSKSKEKDKS